MRVSVFFCVVAATAFAQADATFSGRVIDASGAVVSAAALRVNREAGGYSATAVSDARGNWELKRLPAGTYSIRATAAGLAPFAQGGVVVTAPRTRLDIVLDAGPALFKVSVTAKAAPLESEVETSTRNHQDVLEIREVRESQAKDVGEALSRVEGIWKIRKGGIANDVAMRGFQQDNLNVLIDGARIHGACPSKMDPAVSHVDFAEVSHVEVTHGPFDMTAQGSLGGAIRIVSKTPEAGLAFNPGFSAGSYGFYNPSMVASVARPRVFALAGYSFRRARAYEDGAGNPVTDYANYRLAGRDDEAFRASTGWLRAGGTPAERQRLVFAYTRQQSGRTLYPYLQMDGVYDNADRVSGSWLMEDVPGSLDRLRLEGYFTRVKHWMTDEWRTTSAGAARPFGMGASAHTRMLGMRADAEASGFTFGVEGYRRNWDAVNTLRLAGAYTDQQSLPDVWMTVAGAYAQFRRTFLGRLHVNGGARFDAASMEARHVVSNSGMYLAYHGTTARRRGDANPSGSVWASYALARGLELFAGVGRAVRFPDPQERFFALKRMGTDWVGNPTLRATRNTEVDAGLTLRRHRISIRPTLFYSRLADFVTVRDQQRLADIPYVTNAAARSYGNIAAEIYGGELTWSLALSRAMLLLGGVSYARGAERRAGCSGNAGCNLPEMPPLRSRGALRYGGRLFFAEAEGVVANAQDRVNTTLRERRTPGYGVLNLKAGVHSAKVKVAAGIDNLLDRFYYEHYSFQRDPFRSGVTIPEPGRSVFLTISYSF